MRVSGAGVSDSPSFSANRTKLGSTKTATTRAATKRITVGLRVSRNRTLQRATISAIDAAEFPSLAARFYAMRPPETSVIDAVVCSEASVDQFVKNLRGV